MLDRDYVQPLPFEIPVTFLRIQLPLQLPLERVLMLHRQGTVASSLQDERSNRQNHYRQHARRGTESRDPELRRREAHRRLMSEILDAKHA